MKLVRYILMFWLPFYLQSRLHLDPATAAYASVLFDVGGAFGNVACGMLSDKLFDALHRLFHCQKCIPTTWATKLLVFGFCVDSVREKDWRYRKRGAQPAVAISFE